MEPTTHPPAELARARALVDQILRTGIMLAELVADLADSMPPEAFPGEHPAEVLVGMIAGSTVPVTEAAGEAAVERAIALLGAVGDRTLSDLREAVELSRRGG